MTNPHAFGGGVFIADTSAWRRSHREPVRTDWESALAIGQIATCAIVMLELLYVARNGSEFDVAEAELRSLRDVPVTRSVTQAALSALRQLAHHSPGLQRVKTGDVLVAACAQDAGIGVLHYDHHYDRLAEVMRFESRWIAPAGSLG